MARTSREIIELAKSDPGKLTPKEIDWLNREMAKRKQAGEKLVTRAEAAQAIGVAPEQLTRWAADGMPRVGKGHAARYDVDACRAWIESNVQQRGPYKGAAVRKTGSDQSPHTTAAPRPALPDDDPILMALRSGQSSRIAILNAQIKMASSAIADEYQQTRRVPTVRIDGYLKLLKGLNEAEEREFAAEYKRGKWMEIEEVREKMGAVVAAVIRICETLTNALPTEAQIWRTMQDMPSEQFVRIVREWAERIVREVRRLEADRLIERK